MRYLVKVHCCGAHWIAHVPAIDCWTLVRDKRQIRMVAGLMIADMMGTDSDAIELDLSEGRAVSNVDEFTAGTAASVRCWVPGHGEQSAPALPGAVGEGG
ncbi:hypothetical protein ACIP5Y_33640 [Nocardia sp. NPDC088792]|uniref:hypothetical protein n=1 Tax=Nocardia sp. NPDC088792 TaxID=3364332 RepID=UPI0038157044